MSCPSKEQILDAINAVGDGAAVEQHVASCAACRGIYDGLMSATELLSSAPAGAPPAGPCLSEAQITSYARRNIHPGQEALVETHLASCSKCLDEVAALAEALDEEPAEASDELHRRVLAAGPLSASGVHRAVSRRAHRPASSRRLLGREGMPAYVWYASAAAALLMIILLFSVSGNPPPAGPGPGAKKDKPKKEEVAETPKEEPRRVVQQPPKKEEPKPVPPKEEPKPFVKETPKEEPRPIPPKQEPRKEEPKPLVTNPPQEEPKPRTDPKTAVAAVKFVPVTITNIHGALSKRPASGAVEKVGKSAAVAKDDQIFTDHRHVAGFTVAGAYRGTLEASTALRLEQREAGETRLALVDGKVFLSVEKREQPFVVATPHVEAVVVGTSFQVETDEKKTTLSVLEGAVKFKNERGEVLVKAGHRSTARAKTAPTAPARWDVAGETSWTKRPDLAEAPKKEKWIEHTAGGNKKLSGLVVCAPYFEGESPAGGLAVATSELLDAGLVLGHHYRDTETRVWMNVDRTTEHEVFEDGTRGPGKVTPEARRAFAEYLSHVRGAAGVGPKEAVPMIFNFRAHSTTVGNEELEMAEAAWTGFSKKAIQDAKALYYQLLDKYKPSYRMDMRFEEIDATYDYKGQPRKIMFTESDAESDGYMAPANARNTVAIFVNPSFWRKKAEVDIYARIFAEMAEFLWARKK